MKLLIQSSYKPAGVLSLVSLIAYNSPDMKEKKTAASVDDGVVVVVGKEKVIITRLDAIS